MWFIIVALYVVVFFVGVWLAPVVRGEYQAFKAYIEAKEQAARVTMWGQVTKAEQAAKDKAIGVVNKL